MKKKKQLFFCQKFCITFCTDSLLLNATVGSWFWFYSEPTSMMLIVWRIWFSQYWIYLPYLKNHKFDFMFIFFNSE